MSKTDNDDSMMAECGNCRAVIPSDSTECPECNIKFSGMSEEDLGECGACGFLVPLESTSCSSCGVIFVADDVMDVLRKWLSNTGLNIKSLFDKFDTNGDGIIDSDELRKGLLSLNLADLPPSQVERLIEQIDIDGDGKIDLAELEKSVTGSDYVASKDETEEDSDKGEEDEADEETEEDSDKVEEDEVDEKTEEDSDEVEEDEAEEDDSVAAKEDEADAEKAMINLCNAIISNGMTIREAFESIDKDGDGRINGPELQAGLKALAGDELSAFEVVAILGTMDEDGDGTLDPMELVKALESLDMDLTVDHTPEQGDESNEILPDDILKLMIDAMDRNDSNPATIFHALDEDGDKFISVEELTNTINDVLEEDEISEDSISNFVATLDTDSDGNIDIIEFISAIEGEIGIDSVDDDEEEKIPKEFPSAIQSSMMSKKWSDIWWPLIHAAFFIFILAWVVNGSIGLVDGSGGPVELDSKYGMGFEGVSDGEIYSCDSDVQADKCANSLTPFSGENGASSMPKGFYADGIFFIILGIIGMGGSMFTHLVLAKGWRARVKAMKEVESDTEDAKEASEGDDEDDSDSDDEGDSDDDEEQVKEESDGDSDSDDEEDSDEEDSDEEDDIDIGSHIGLTVEDEDFFGVIIEFDDEDKLVTIKEDGSGDEITGYQDEMFLE